MGATRTSAENTSNSGPVVGGVPVLWPIARACTVVCTTNQSLTAFGVGTVVDGVTTGVSDRILLAGQTDSAENGPRIVQADGSLLRDLFWSREFPVKQGTAVVVMAGGTTYGSSVWVATSSNTGLSPTITPDIDEVTFTQLSYLRPTVPASAGNVPTLAADGTLQDSLRQFTTDTTLHGGSAANTRIPTELAVKTYADGLVASLVTGPASAVSGNIPTFNGTTGKIVQDSLRAFSTDGTFASNTNLKVPTEAAVKTYVDTADAATLASANGTSVPRASTPAPPVDIQTFTAASGTWTKPTAPTGCAAYTTVEIILLGAGGGGGSGRRGAAGSVRCGGGGAGGGAWTRHVVAASSLGATETVYVGIAGTGGAAQTADNTDGISGTAGGNSIFGAAPRRALATGGSAGAGGSATAGAGGTGGNGFMCGTQGGSANGSGGGGANGNGNINATSAYGYSGSGAAGGGLSAADAVSNGGTGGPLQYQGLGGGASGTLGAAGGNGTAASIGTGEVLGGSGGGGGGSSKLANAGAGGNGGGYGSGGGGGGASLNGFNSGAGGNGAGGLVVVITR